MLQRYEHREVTGRLFQELIIKTEVPKTPSWPVSQRLQEIRKLEQQNAMERSEWLDRFEKDVILDNLVLAPDQVVRGIADTSLEIPRGLVQ